MAVRLHVWGNFACFTRPEMKAERYSYDVMTPSAARGILEAIYWHHGVNWHITKITVCKPIQFITVKRNEVSDKFSVSNLQKYEKGEGELPVLHPSEKTAQRSSTVLKNVEYIIDAYFTLDNSPQKGEEQLSDAKVVSIFNRRAQKGQYYHHPYFGTREFPVEFEWMDPTQKPVIAPINETKDLGFMLLDFDFTQALHPVPLFFHARLDHGIMNVPSLTSSEVHR